MKLGIPVVRRYDLLEQLLASVLVGTEVPDEILIVDNGHQPHRIPTLPRVRIIYSGPGLGCCGAYNLLLKAGASVLSNDDIVLPPKAFREIADALRAGHHVAMGLGFAFYGQLPTVARTIGYYDEDFFPAYFEDSDYMRRLRLAGFVVKDDVLSAPVQHLGWGSSRAADGTLLDAPAHHAGYEKNRQRYLAKWGGPPGEETYDTPYNQGHFDLFPPGLHSDGDARLDVLVPVPPDAERRACITLSTQRDAPADARATANQNTRFYTRSAADTFGAVCLPIDAPALIHHPRLVPTNPSVAIDPATGALRATLRWVNYRVVNDGYMHPDGDGVFRTENELVTLEVNENFAKAVQRKPIIDHSGVVIPPFPVRGYEDLRLVWWDGRWMASGTAWGQHPAGRPEMALLTLQEEHASVAITDVVLQRQHDTSQPQKNWIPIAREEGATFLANVEPTTVVEAALGPTTHPFPSAGVSCTLHPVAHDLTHHRGSSQAIPFPLDGQPGYLMVTHEAFTHPHHGRCYTHRFVWMTDDYRIERVSEPFHFLARQIEFCAGLALTHRQGLRPRHPHPGSLPPASREGSLTAGAPSHETLVLSFGVRDCEAWIALADPDRVRSLLTSNAPSRTP